MKHGLICLLVALTLSIAANTATARQKKLSSDQWFAAGQAAIKSRLAQRKNMKTAKNIILFIGDGMGVSTVTAARIFDGQSTGGFGEENRLSFEKFPYIALVKTYETNQQVADSAGTATAMNTGIKTRAGVLGISGDAHRQNCLEALAHPIPTFGEIAKRRGKAVGIVTTARITHATPAAVYAHTPERNWESDAEVPARAKRQGCHSIARQLLEFTPGNGIDVAFGGGRKKFTKKLLREWKARHPEARLITDRTGLMALTPADKTPLLGLFSTSHMTYMLDRPADSNQPTLSEMTASAIDLLSRHKKGYYLMVEGGRIDHGHHEGSAGKALTEAQEFAKAVQVALDKVDLSKTLILVTADHSHVFTINGYPTRGNPILGLVRGNDSSGDPTHKPVLALDGKPYTTLGYYDGPGAIKGKRKMPETGLRAHQQAAIPTSYHSSKTRKKSETHGGEDVTLYAIGPGAYLASGVMEQNVIFHIMAHAYGWPQE